VQRGVLGYVKAGWERCCGAAEQMRPLLEAYVSPGNWFSAMDLPQSGI